ncbi:unnamed protein product, partial [Discosporangium mesarthrocarpum]
CIVTELLSRGSLEDIILEVLKRPIPLPLITFHPPLCYTRTILQAARGMLFLHSHSPPICHRDLKSSNLVVDERWHVKARA